MIYFALGFLVLAALLFANAMVLLAKKKERVTPAPFVAGVLCLLVCLIILDASGGGP